MKIIHVLWGLENGGIETMLVNVVNEQVLCGDRVFIIIINNLVNKDLLRNINPKVKIYQIGRSGGSKKIWPIFKINFILLVIYPQIIHFHFLNIAKMFIKYPKIKFITTIHNPRFTDRYFRKTDVFIAISNSVSHSIKEINNKISPIICYNAIDFKLLNKKDIYRPIKNLVCVGRLIDTIKGQSVIIEAIRILKFDYNINISISFIGKGPSKNHLQNLTKKLKLENNINFLGDKSNEWVMENLQSYDLFIQASKYEGFGLTALEAIGARLPLILSNVDGHLELSENGKYATLFKCNDPKDLADKIVELSNKFETLENKSIKSFEFVINKFSIKKQVDCLNEIYKL
jgi:glycosyltransferase involved in cell wall biosynthesis